MTSRDRWWIAACILGGSCLIRTDSTTAQVGTVAATALLLVVMDIAAIIRDHDGEVPELPVVRDPESGTQW